MKCKFLFSLLLIMFVYNANSQVTIFKPDKIDDLVLLRQKRKYKGYRVQIGYSTDRKVVEEIQMKFLNEFSDIQTKMVFEAPYFNLKVGNFRKKIEAQLLIEKIKFSYPLANLIEEEIDLPSVN